MVNSHALAAEQTLKALERDIAARSACRQQIHGAVNTLMERERGVAGFLDRAGEWFPPQENELSLVFGRQVPTVSLENLGVELLADWMSGVVPTRAETLAFTHDCWARSSHKQGLTCIPVIQHVNGAATIRSCKVVPRPSRAQLANLMLLKDIPTHLCRPEWNMEFAGTLPSLHSALRSQAGATGGTQFDVSHAWSECLRASTRPPSFVFREQNGHAVRATEWSPTDEAYIRPPATWYYLLYLSLFCTGERALVATTIEEDDESIRNLFQESIALIQEACGVPPLIVWMPHCARVRKTNGMPLDFTEVNPAVFQSGWRDRLTQPAGQLTCYDAADDLLNQLIML